MQISENERKLINEFLSSAFTATPHTTYSEEEGVIINEVLLEVKSNFAGKKYILGQALNFTMLSQKLSNIDTEAKKYNPNLTLDDIFNRYELITTRGKTTANTLTLKLGACVEGIRKIEESVANLFHSMDRSDYPSAYVYNSGQWKKYQDMMLLCFKLSEPAKYKLCLDLIAFGMSAMPKNSFYIRDFPRKRLLELIIKNYERGVKGENGGVIFQAIAYGLLIADRPHLSIMVDKVRTGSSRQKRFGDIDCYYGFDLELSVEVKDFEITQNNFDKELGEFCRNCQGNQIVGVVFAESITDSAKEIVSDYGVRAITQDDISYLVSFWDWQKQNAAVQAILHYISHIEQNPSAVERMLSFIHEIDSSYDSLVYRQN